MDGFVLATERLVIRRFSPDDWRDLHRYLSDPEVVHFEPYEPLDEVACREQACARAAGDDFYAVCLRDSGRLIGNLYLHRGDFDTGEFGYVFARDVWGSGCATEAALALIGHAFETGVHRIEAMCNPENRRSWALLERLGFRREGHLVQNVYFRTGPGGEPLWQDTYIYGLLCSEWPSAHGIISGRGDRR